MYDIPFSTQWIFDRCLEGSNNLTLLFLLPLALLVSILFYKFIKAYFSKKISKTVFAIVLSLLVGLVLYSSMFPIFTSWFLMKVLSAESDGGFIWMISIAVNALVSLVVIAGMVKVFLTSNVS